MSKLYLIYQLSVKKKIESPFLKTISLVSLPIIFLPIIFNADLVLVEKLVVNIFGAVIIFINILTAESLFTDDVRVGFFKFLKKYKINIEIYVFLKIFIHWLKNYGFLHVLFLLYTALYLTGISLIKFSFIILLQSFCITLIIALGGFLLSNNKYSMGVIFLLLVPFLLPIFLLSTELVAVTFSGSSEFFFKNHVILLSNCCFIISIIPWVLSCLIQISIK